MLLLDGALGEGGGQVLRSALALSLALGRPFRIQGIRANRSKPGLRRQHLTCVLAAQTLGGAEVAGAELGSRELTFIPGSLRPGDYAFDVGGGGSAALVLQALVPPLLLAAGPSRLAVTGGTHVPKAPVFEFLQKTLFPRLEQMGPRLRAAQARPGFSRFGGGRLEVEIEPVPRLKKLAETNPGTVEGAEAAVLSHGLAEELVARERRVLLKSGAEAGLNLEGARIDSAWPPGSAEPQGSGLAVLVEVRQGGWISVFSEIGEQGLRAGKAARLAAGQALRFIRAEVPICEHLADQLVVPLALAGGGRFLTQTPETDHLQTCLSVAELFTGLQGRLTTMNERQCLVEIAP